MCDRHHRGRPSSPSSRRGSSSPPSPLSKPPPGLPDAHLHHSPPPERWHPESVCLKTETTKAGLGVLVQHSYLSIEVIEQALGGGDSALPSDISEDEANEERGTRPPDPGGRAAVRRARVRGRQPAGDHPRSPAEESHR